MGRGRLILSFLSFVLSTLVLTGCEEPEERRRPNVILIALDTLRADHLEAYGHPRPTAPYLDRLAERSAVFTNAYSTSSWTAPATASLLTGMYPDRHGVLEGFMVQVAASVNAGAEELRLRRINRAASTLAESFGQRGYSTFGLASNINVGEEMGFDRGFDRFERRQDWSAREIHTRLQAWKDELLSGGPYFLYLHFNDVHKPYELRRRWYVEAEGEPQATIARYQSELGFLDHFLDRIHQELDWDGDDLIAVVSDHGEEFLDHGDWGHHFSLYQELNRIVFLLHAPGLGVVPGRVTEPVSIVDVGPTLLDLAGLPATGETDGMSVAQVIRAGVDPSRAAEVGAVLSGRTVFAHRKDGEKELWAAIRDGWKLIQGPDGIELYDLGRDPGETVDLAGEEPDRARSLERELDAYRARRFQVDSQETEIRLDGELMEHLREIGYAR